MIRFFTASSLKKVFYPENFLLEQIEDHDLNKIILERKTQ
jgi:hypothetical protein